MRTFSRLGETLSYLGLPFLAAATGVLFRPGPWYAGLRKPPGVPPDMVFPLVWTLLYLLMGTAALLVARTDHAYRPQALRLFLLQLACNAAWSLLMFGLHRPTLALADLLLLDVLVLATLLAFRQVRPLAAVLLWPYLAWILYATYLNAGIVVLN